MQPHNGMAPSTVFVPVRPQHHRLGGHPSSWGPSNQPHHRPIGIGFGRQELIGRAIGGSRDGVSGQIGGQLRAGLDGGISIDPRTGRVRGQIQAGVEGSVIGGIGGPAGGAIQSLTRGLSGGIAF